MTDKINTSAKGYINKIQPLNNAAGEEIGVAFLLANGSEKYPSSVNVVAWGDLAKEIRANYSEKGSNFVFIETAYLTGESFEKDGQNKVGSTNLIATSVVPGKAYVQGAPDNQVENVTARGFVTHTNGMKEGNGVSGLLSYTTGEGEKAKQHTVKFVAFGDAADFIKADINKGDLVQFSEGQMNGRWKEDKLMPTVIVVSDLERLKSKSEQGYVDNKKTLQEYIEEVSPSNNP